jgi:nucleotide-binding universal stress UspA family protein
MENSSAKEKSTILVPVDYSEYSKLACQYAAKIANKSNSDICLFHAFYSPAFDLIELTGGAQTQQQLKADVTKKLLESETVEINKFIDSLQEFPVFEKFDKSRIKFELKSGLAKDEIISFSAEINPFMVVMGTRGANHKSTSILGSITEYAIKKLSVPVLAIPENYKFLGEEKLQKIVYITKFDETDFASITKLMRFTRLFDMSIHCIHIGPKNDKWENIKMEGLKEYFHKVYENEMVECQILDNKPDILYAIDKYVSENGINIISLTHKKRKLIEKVFNPSVAKKVFYHSEIPLMVFHS